MDLNICGQCGKTYRHRRNLLAHERSHAGLLPFSCCGIGYPSRRSLDRHRCTVHGEAKNFVCSNCGKEFAAQDDLTAHQKRERQERVVTCDSCGHKCSTMADMREHLKTHSDEKTHVCRQCRAAYKHKSSLSRHVGHKHK